MRPEFDARRARPRLKRVFEIGATLKTANVNRTPHVTAAAIPRRSSQQNAGGRCFAIRGLGTAALLGNHSIDCPQEGAMTAKGLLVANARLAICLLTVGGEARPLSFLSCWRW